jgi:hypothetical protein
VSAMSYLQKNSERLFNETLSIPQVAKIYKPCVKRKSNYDPAVRVKLNLGGDFATRLWSKQSKLREAPEVWRGANVRIVLQVAHLWFMDDGTCGLTVNCTDLLVVSESGVQTADCPFELENL